METLIFLAHFVDFIHKGRILIETSEMSLSSAVGCLVVWSLQPTHPLTIDFCSLDILTWAQVSGYLHFTTLGSEVLIKEN